LGKEIKERYARKKLHTSFASVCSMKMIVNVQSFAIEDEPAGGGLFPIQGLNSPFLATRISLFSEILVS
jgi:hypothetical protein